MPAPDGVAPPPEVIAWVSQFLNNGPNQYTRRGSPLPHESPLAAASPQPATSQLPAPLAPPVLPAPPTIPGPPVPPAPAPTRTVAPAIPFSSLPTSTTSGAPPGPPMRPFEQRNPPAFANGVPAWPPLPAASSVSFSTLPPAVPVEHFPQLSAHLTGARAPVGHIAAAPQLYMPQQRESSAPWAAWPAVTSHQVEPPSSASPGSARLVPYASSSTHPPQHHATNVAQSTVRAADALRRAAAARHSRTARSPRARGPNGTRATLGPTTRVASPAPPADPVAVNICVQLYPSAVRPLHLLQLCALLLMFSPIRRK